MIREIPNPDGGRPIPPPLFLTEQEADMARHVARKLAGKRAENGDPVLSVWSQYEASVALIDEMAGGRG